MMKLEPGVSNPWDSKALEDFLHFLCPECNYLTKYSDDFLQHSANHPMANDFILNHQDIMEEDTTNVEDDEEQVEPTEFVDCSVMDGSEAGPEDSDSNQQQILPFPLPLPPSMIKLPPGLSISHTNVSKIKSNTVDSRFSKVNRIPPNKSKKAVTWDEEVEQTWTEFKQYVNYKEDYTAEEIINYLTQTMNARKISVSTMINLKSRLSIAYRNETGRTFQEDFSEVNEYCKSVGIKPNHSKAYHKKKERVYKDFVTSTDKGLNFDEVDLQHYCDTLKNEQMLSFNSAKLNLASIQHGYQRDTGLDFKAIFPAINQYIRNLYDKN